MRAVGAAALSRDIAIMSEYGRVDGQRLMPRLIDVKADAIRRSWRLARLSEGGLATLCWGLGMFECGARARGIAILVGRGVLGL